MSKDEEILALKRILDYVTTQLSDLATSIKAGRMNVEGQKFGKPVKRRKK